MVTIQNLEVQFDVVGDGDEAVFARLFQQHIRQHMHNQQLQRDQERRIEAECQLGECKPELPR